MVSFTSDYIAGAHPKVLERLVETNLETLTGYGTDKYCMAAEEKIKKAFGLPDAQVFFLTGGTQANQVITDTVLAPYQGVIAADTGHISCHEAGAIEFTGHKVIQIKGNEGIIDIDETEEWLKTFYADENHIYMVFPGMIYISYPTEYGTLYTKAQLERLYRLCRQYNMSLFIDGARLGYGLASKACDITPEEIGKLCDVFYVGGTKVGALCGEAVVFTHANAPENFMTRVKQHGAMIAKGRLIGVQFDALFTDGLYMEIGRYGIAMAEKVIALFKEKGYRFYLDSPTNQQFIILENGKMAELSKKVSFGFWEKYDENHTVVRFATSWSTTDEDINTLKELI